MFDQLKNLNNLRKQASELQKQLEAEKITTSSSDNIITLTLNGSHELIDLKINADFSQTNAEQVAAAFKSAYNKAQSELKLVLAKKFQGII